MVRERFCATGAQYPMQPPLPCPKPMSPETLPFEVWKSRLRDDCERCGKAKQFEVLSDYVLQLFWQRGVEPSVDGLIGDDQTS